MKGRILAVLKKWWVLALVVTLALSLTSCSKRRVTNLTNGSFGFGYCDSVTGEWQFDVYVIPRSNGFDVDLVIVPFRAFNGDIVTVGIVNSQTLGFKVVMPQQAVQVDAEMATIITVSDVLNYDVLAIRPFTGAATFLDGNPPIDAICPLPLPPSLSGGNIF